MILYIARSICSVPIMCRVYQGTPGVTVLSCLCLYNYMLVTAATWPSQLCGCGLLASVQDFMPPAWTCKSVKLFLLVQCLHCAVPILHAYWHIYTLLFFLLSFPKIFQLHCFSLWAMCDWCRDVLTHLTMSCVCMAVVTWVCRCSLFIFNNLLLILLPCFFL